MCGDGIDIRGMNTGDIGVQVNYNFITRLVQCRSVSAIQGISTQVTGTFRLRATLFGNTEADNGSPGANMDRLFVNPAESGTLVSRWRPVRASISPGNGRNLAIGWVGTTRLAITVRAFRR